MEKKRTHGPTTFEKMSSAVTRATGSTAAFIIALLVIVVWLITGPIFHYSDTWQLVINTGTTIVTFLMVFLIQRSQNKDSIALHLKLNELVVANELASNRLVSVEDISEEELKVLRKFYKQVAIMTLNEKSVEETHSMLKAGESHQRKSSIGKARKEEKKPE